MVSASSVISVALVGDAKKLIAATKSADKATGGLLSSTAKVATGLFIGANAIEKGFDFIGDSLGEFDRLGDATFNLKTQLGDLADPLIAAAEGFERIGASKQDMIEMEARFADLATATGIADEQIALFADDAAATAAAMALLSDKEPDQILDLIAKAAGGATKAAKELGVTLLDNVDPATQLRNILDQLKPKLDAAMTGTMDLEQQQKFLQARIETLQGKIGEGLTPVILDFWEGLNLVLDAIPGVVDDLANFAEGVGSLLAPLARAADLLDELLGKPKNLQFKVGFTMSANDAATLAAVQREERRNSGPQGRD